MTEKSKTVIDLENDALAVKKFIREMYKFILHPDMMDGEWEHAPLKKAVSNLIYSLCYMGAFLSLLSWFLQSYDVVDFSAVINSIGLVITLAIQAVIFAIIFWLLASFVTNFKRRGWHYLYFMQVLQTYALIYFFVVGLFWLVLNRIIVTGDSRLAVNAWDFSIGIMLIIFTIGLAIWVLVVPVKKYLFRYYKSLMSWLLTICIFFGTFTANAYFHIGVGNRLVNYNTFCEYLSERKAQSNSFDLNQKAKMKQLCLKLTRERAISSGE